MDVNVRVEGMTCGGCVASVTRALRAVEGVEDVAVSLERAEAAVRFDPSKTTPAALRRAVEDAGFDAPA